MTGELDEKAAATPTGLASGQATATEGGPSSHADAASTGSDAGSSAADAAPVSLGQFIRDPSFASPRATVCPFLRSDAGELGMTFPVETPDPSNVCTALDEPLAQSQRQQELVCLQAAHASCPRYLRGAMAAPVPPRPAQRRLVSPAVAASLVVLVVSALISVGYVAAAGGLSAPLGAAAPTATPSPTVAPSTVAVASPSVAAVSPSVAPTPTLAPTPAPTATPAPSPSPSTVPVQEPSAAPTPSPEPTQKPSPTSDRFQYLTKCPNRSNCWIYTVRRGDNLYSIAHWLGVSLDAIYQMNPWTQQRGIRAGDELLVPTPTR